jgi:hypothetical protein
MLHNTTQLHAETHRLTLMTRMTVVTVALSYVCNSNCCHVCRTLCCGFCLLAWQMLACFSLVFCRAYGFQSALLLLY